MFRLRRYRFYVAFAALALIFLYRTTRYSEWEGFSSAIDFNPLPKSNTGSGVIKDAVGSLDINRKRPENSPKSLSEEQPAPTIKIPTLKSTVEEDAEVNYNLPTSTPLPEAAATLLDNYEPAPPKPTVPPVLSIPDRKTPDREWAKNKEESEKLVGVAGHGGARVAKSKTRTSTTVIHWTKPIENFPVASDSIIPVPTGKPKSIPKVQHVFGDESAEAREKREDRLSKVKAEMTRAWTGYKTYAWMHDELSPVNKRFRDPFCGWAATLVDALDTLWIMGMKEEFDDAVKAVAAIDFTTTKRTEIPVFETTIRYLGGFLGAFDVTGGHNGEYKILLDKAVELAEILMGVFDTPNRMPILYYNWKPENTRLPKQAAFGVSIAELGSLAMEFTRLAQLTKEDKYYDAVARITDALYEWQNRPGGTTIPGIFPERVDVSGCNATAASEAESKLSQQAIEIVQSVVATPEDYTGREYSKTSPGQGSGTALKSQLNNKVIESGLQKAKSQPGKTNNLQSRMTVDDKQDLHGRPVTAKKEDVLTLDIPIKAKGSWAPDIFQKMRSEGYNAEPFKILGLDREVCYPQNLTSGGWGLDSFSMGGSQDSTYEYFPKQFLLLGGLEPKYRDMHLMVSKAVKEWLLYRPMVPGDRDILFSAKVSTRGKPEKDLVTEFEVTHLTCFLGGMFAMAGKIFEDPIDLEVGKKLTEGCVWAYESMPTGIMPEGATVVPCAEASNCHWNETVWWQYLDPMWATRDVQVEEYIKLKEENKRKKAEQAELNRLREQELRREANLASEKENVLGTGNVNVPGGGSEGSLARPVETEVKRTPAEPLEKDALKKRDFDTTAEVKVEASSKDGLTPTKTAKTSTAEDRDDALPRLQTPVQPGQGQIPLTEDEDDSMFPDPARPLSHKEFVASRIKNEVMQPGYVSVNSKRYILRPEAIESVWYMYRITGDTTWQDKGWKMFEAIISATKTQSGHSAIDDVLTPGSRQLNEMESFWLAETLKYFYLLYSTPEVISLDEWVLNTEAHPFKRPS